MKSIIYLTLIIGIIIVLTLLSTTKNNKAPSMTEESFICPKSKYYKKQKFNYPKVSKIFKEDEEINYHIDVPLVKKRKPFYRGWRDFNREKFMKSEVPEENSFDGTPIRNYLDNLNYFHN